MTQLFITLFLGLTANLALAAAADNNLTRTEAERRAKLVSDVHYVFAFQLSGDAPEFTGTESVTFSQSTNAQPLALDFGGGQVQSLTVNGATSEKIVYDGHELLLPSQLLKTGPNTVQIKFSHPYSANGRGLYRFKDPEDGKIYTYSDFEPNDANQLFPCFDQPDLKATFTLTAEVPTAWQVVSSTRETSIEPSTAGRKLWRFPESAKFSTYLFSLHAGPFHVWEGKAGNIPQRLFARESMVKYVDADFWLKTTAQGLAFYQSYFDIPYAFAKYDQLIVPDFNAGAMENVAAITFSERYLPRGEPTRENRQGLVETLLHEMAHQWFGDLVTMRWWNDLWLNESFATYMSQLAAAEATDFKDVTWLAFFSQKRGAYYEDQLVTTHAIEGDVPDTEHAFASFDGITYGKGASTLKQLSFFVGAETFRDGVRRYLKAHAYANATRADFIASVAAAAGKDLSTWSSSWLTTAGVNKVEARYRCDAGKISSFSLVQTAAPNLRPHRTNVGLYYEGKGGTVTLGKTLPVTYLTADTKVDAALGAECPTLVFPNTDDQDYSNVRLDDRTLTAAKTKMTKITDPLLRMMLWSALWEMVQDGETSVVGFADALLTNAPTEHEPKVEQLFGTLVNNRRRYSSVLLYLPQQGSHGDLRASYGRKFEALSARRLADAQPNSDDQKLWYDIYVPTANSPEALRTLAGWLEAKTPVPSGLKLDADRRWAAILQLNMRGGPGASALLKKEASLDKSNAGALAALEASAAQPDQTAKAAWFKEITGANGYTQAQLKAIMRSLLPPLQPAFRRRFAPSVYATLAANLASKPHDYLRAYVNSLTPITCDRATQEELTAFFAAHRDLSPSVAKPLHIAAQENERCIKAQTLAGQDQATH